MPMHTKVAGAWVEVDAPQTKVAGTWQDAKEGFVKVSGAWQSFYTAIVFSGTITVGSTLFPSINIEFRGYSATGEGTLAPDTVNGRFIRAISWNGSPNRLTLEIDVVDPLDFDSMQIGSTIFLRASATTLTDQGRRLYRWEPVTNPFGTVDGVTRQVTIK